MKCDHSKLKCRNVRRGVKMWDYVGEMFNWTISLFRNSQWETVIIFLHKYLIMRIQLGASEHQRTNRYSSFESKTCSLCASTGCWWSESLPSTWCLTTWKPLRGWSVFTTCTPPWTPTLSSKCSTHWCKLHLVKKMNIWRRLSWDYIKFEVCETFSSSVPLRALNEMWKCQNLLRHHVKDLLDLIKKPKVPLTEACYKNSCVHILPFFMF